MCHYRINSRTPAPFNAARNRVVTQTFGSFSELLGLIAAPLLQFLIRAAYGVELLAKFSKGL